MRIALLIALLGLAGTAALAQEILREGNMEKLVLSAGADAKAWNSAEATMTPSADRTRTGKPALHFHVDVDYHTGEAAYPIGWPRTNLATSKPWQGDWSGFDTLRCWVYSDTSREALPRAPLGFNINVPDKGRSFHTILTDLKKGEWVQVEIPLTQVADRETVKSIQFYISESDYRDHDVVDFYVDDLCLLRYAEPTLSELAVRPAVMFADAGHVVVSFEAQGIKPGEQAEARASLIAAGKPLRDVREQVARGAGMLVLDIGKAPLPPGDYAVRVQLGNGDPKELPLRVVASPWMD